MTKRTILAIWLAAAAAWADDEVQTSRQKFEGKATISPTEVVVETAASTEKIPVNEVQWIAFDGEPAGMRTVRAHLAKADYQAASDVLDRLKLDTLDRDEARQELLYLRAFAAAKLALAGSGEIAPAGKLMRSFVEGYPSSHHFLEANELLGDLLVAMGRPAMARPYYAKVAAAPWPSHQMRAGVAMGNVLLAEGNPAEAIKAFDAVMKNAAPGEIADAQRSLATIGMSRALVETGDAARALKGAQFVIDRADPETQPELLARAYLAQGLALDKAGKPREAMFAFLHVDALYSGDAEAHAECLFHLRRIFEQLRKPDRAREAQTTLQEQYGESRWAKAAK